MSDSFDRLDFAITLSRAAGARALEAFRAIETLTIESKGHQDLVSNADRETEAYVRAEIARVYPEDGIVGEEEAPKESRSGWTWVIDPIDGTANFVSGIPAWCVILACVHEGETQVGAICEPASGETFWAGRGKGAFVNGKKLAVSQARSLAEGSLGTGFAARESRQAIVGLIDELIGAGGMFFRNASGGLMLAYVAAGRLIGYVEEEMNAWDCLAGLLMIEEAGGIVEKPAAETILTARHRLVAGGPNVYQAVATLAGRHLP